MCVQARAAAACSGRAAQRQCVMRIPDRILTPGSKPLGAGGLPPKQD